MPVQRLSDSYSEGLTSASMSALLELTTALYSYRDAIVLIGGWVPYFLLQEFGRGYADHVGSIDIDLAVDPDLVDEGGYADIVKLIEDRGWTQRFSRNGQPISFSYEKEIPSPIDQNDYLISVDFLTSGSPETGKHRHRVLQPGFKARVTKGCDIAFHHNYWKEVHGILPANGETIANIKMLDIPGCLSMKGIVLGAAYREKDAYDIFTVVSNCHESPTHVANTIKPLLHNQGFALGIQMIHQRFRDILSEGPAWVANFLQPVDQNAKERVMAEVYVDMKEFLETLENPN